jgi:hypothetical protein
MTLNLHNIFAEKSPCDNCDQQNDCKEFELACRAFSGYVLHGIFYEHTARCPTHGLFNKIFKEDDKALKTYMKSVRAKEQMGIVDLFEKEETDGHQN